MAEEEKKWKPTDEELKDMLQEHRLWLNSHGSQGKQLNLQGADLSGAQLFQGIILERAIFQNTNLQNANVANASLWAANMRSANLRGASLQVTNLQMASFQRADLEDVSFQPKGEEARSDNQTEAPNLTDTNFRHASLRGACLRGACFNGTNLQDADLTDADLTKGTRLSSQQLAGANANGTRLPDSIARFDSLKQVDEASQSTKRIFLGMLLACAYSALTIFSTTDAQLLPNSASSPLPIIGTSIPIAGFFAVAPAILLAIFFYFHLYLQDLWEHLALLPAVFPDGTPLNKRVFPWLLNGLVQRYLPRLKPYRTAMYPLRVVVASLLAWWTVPLTIAFFWVRYAYSGAIRPPFRSNPATHSGRKRPPIPE